MLSLKPRQPHRVLAVLGVLCSCRSSLSGQDLPDVLEGARHFSGKVGEVTPPASSCQVWVDGGWAPLPRATAPVGHLQGLVTTPCLCHFKPRTGPGSLFARP